ncbi:SAF domain-containing protein [Propionibacteriaceae bacterium Y2011]|uniref:SAF domain-containing protein n=1 Tax=Microlunatus sp. Y2014 TaxID=3418488 RepID=UPI003B45502B
MSPTTVPTGTEVAAPISVPTPGAAAARNRRRPMLILLAVLLLAVSALAGAWAFTQLDTTHGVVGVTRTVSAGEVIGRDDLTVVQISEQSTLDTVPAADLESIIGRRAVTDLPAGTTLPPGSVADVLVPAKGNAVVGVLTTPGTAPVAGMAPGARVWLVPVAAAGAAEGEPGTSTTPATGVEGRVIAVTPLADGSGSRVDVEVAASAAIELQQLAAADRLGIVLISKER